MSAKQADSQASELGPVILATSTACLAIVALVAGVGGWLLQPATWLERALLIAAAGLLLHSGPLQDSSVSRYWLLRSSCTSPASARRG